MKKEHSSRWRKLDNAAQAFPAATGKKDTRVFRFYCQLKEDIQADLLQKALEETMEHYPVFSMVLRKGLFWFYLEQRDLPAKVEEEKRPPCSEIYVPDHKTLLFQVSYYKTRINFEVFHALTDGTGAMLFLKELVSNYLILCHPEEIFSKVSEDMLTETDFEEDSFSQYYTGKKSEKEKSRPAYQIKGEYLEQEEMEITEILLSAEAVHKCAKAHGVSVTAYLAAALVYAVYEEIPKSRLKKPVSLMVPANLRNFFPSASMTNFWSWIEIACDLGPEASFEDALQITGAAMQKEALKQEISTRMNDLVRIERNPVLRAVPLEIKNLVLGSVIPRETDVLEDDGRIYDQSLSPNTEALRPSIPISAGFRCRRSMKHILSGSDFSPAQTKYRCVPAPTGTAWCLESHLKSPIPILNGT